jgi:cell pole-organizing protein PopZ
MTQPAKSQEPSMEEILASIRRIIADDDASKTVQRAAEPPKPAPRPAPPPPRMPEPEPEPSVPEVQAEELPMPAAPEPELEEDQASDILDLTESMAAPAFESVPPAAPQFRKIEGFSDVSFDESDEPKPAMPRNDTSGLRSGFENGLLSSATSAAVDSAFNALAQTVLVQNARTLEDLVREMLRPMLKSWLDDNLPGMVERLVRAEIERVARGR